LSGGPLFSKVSPRPIGNYVTPGRKGLFELAAKELNNFADKTCQQPKLKETTK
jgi:hypothetical protein